MGQDWPLDAEDFSKYYSFAPTALAVRECARLRAVRRIDLPEPILDVGCGDGLFARLAYPGRQVWGIDVNLDEVKRAQATQAYRTLVCGNISGVQLPEAFFGSAIANCSLEHVVDLPGALRNIRRSLRIGAKFVLIVPNPSWVSQLGTVEFLEKLGLHALARAYGDGLDRVFAHRHLYDADTWQRLIEEAGFASVKVEPLVDRATSHVFEYALAPSLVGYVVKKLTGRWVLLPMARHLTADLTRMFCDSIAKPIADGHASEYLLEGIAAKS